MINPANSQLIVTGDGADNKITVYNESPNYRIHDTNGDVVPGAGCVQGKNSRQVLCPRAVVASSSVTGGKGKDVLNVTVAVPSVISGGDHNDTLRAGSQAWLLGEDGADNLEGSPGNDILIGGDALDDLDGGFGADVLIAGGGTTPDMEYDWESLSYADRTAPVTVTFDGLANDGQNCPGPNCEGDSVAGDIDVLFGGKGNDVFIAGPTRQQFIGGAGDDTFDGGGGSDIFDGGGGHDTMLYWTRTAPVKVTAEGNLVVGCDLFPWEGCENPAGWNDGEAGEQDRIPANVEGVVGGAGDDWLEGDSGINTLTGLGGSDTLLGEGGNDTINSADNRIDARIECGAGTDTLVADSNDPRAGCER